MKVIEPWWRASGSCQLIDLRTTYVCISMKAQLSDRGFFRLDINVIMELQKLTASYPSEWRSWGLAPSTPRRWTEMIGSHDHAQIRQERYVRHLLHGGQRVAWISKNHPEISIFGDRQNSLCVIDNCLIVSLPRSASEMIPASDRKRFWFRRSIPSPESTTVHNFKI
jgi:hypothetical protein